MTQAPSGYYNKHNINYIRNLAQYSNRRDHLFLGDLDGEGGIQGELWRGD